MLVATEADARALIAGLHDVRFGSRLLQVHLSENQRQARQPQDKGVTLHLDMVIWKLLGVIWGLLFGMLVCFLGGEVGLLVIKDENLPDLSGIKDF